MLRVRLFIAFAALLACAPALGADTVAPAPEPVTTQETVDAALYARELRTVEEDVKRLKERVFRSKATLQLLKEIIVEGAGMGSRVVLWHVNKMGPSYTVDQVTYFLDGKSVFTRSAEIDGDLDGLREARVHEQTIPPGVHTLQVQMVLRGNGLGVFSYLESYSFKVQSSYQFEVKDGEMTTLRVIANERSGFARTFVDRPSVQYEEAVETYRREAVRTSATP